jgi:sugar lactone lactonase YvrE
MTSARTAAAWLLCGVSALVTGCSANQFLSGTDTTPVVGAAFKGVVHGGQNPINSATIQLWTVGTGSYGATATKLGPALTTGPAGGFTNGSFAYAPNSYTCPSGSALTYITSTSGDPGLGTGVNPNIVLAAATGACSTLASATINIDEVTTAATAYALGQYFTTTFGGSSTDSFGAPSTTQAQAGIANAFATVNNLVTNSTGTALTSASLLGSPSGAITAWSITSNVATFTAANSLAAGAVVTLSGFGTSTFFNGLAVTVLSSGLSGTQFEANVTHANGSATEAGAFNTSVTATPEASKLNTIADILAACVNSAGGTAGDTTTCGTLFADVVPTSGTAPTDTLQAAVYMSLNPTSNNAAGSAANLTALFGLINSQSPFQSPSPLSSAPGDWTVGIQYTGGTTPLNEPQNIAADASGNIWVINHNGTSSASLTELSGGASGALQPGTPEVNVSTIGGFSISAVQPRNEAIDLNGNVWLDTTSTAQMLEYNGGTGVSFAPTTFGSPYGVAIDGNNNVFYTTESSSADFQVIEFLNGSLAGSAEVEYALDSTRQQGEYAAIDASGNLWVTNGSSTSGLEQNIFQMSGYNGSTACTAFPCNVASDASLTQTYTNISAGGSVPTLSEPFGIAAGKAGTGVWMANEGGTNQVTNMTSTTAGTNYGSATSLNKPQYVAVDGAGNVWFTNGGSSTNGSVSEFVGTGSGVGTVLSPVNTGTAPTTTVGFTHSGITTAEGIAIDPSGNVWIANEVASTGGVFEIVGAAAPTVTPISLALKNSAVGVKP